MSFLLHVSKGPHASCEVEQAAKRRTGRPTPAILASSIPAEVWLVIATAIVLYAR
jgi:hypothetical protein